MNEEELLRELESFKKQMGLAFGEMHRNFYDQEDYLFNLIVDMKQKVRTQIDERLIKSEVK